MVSSSAAIMIRLADLEYHSKRMELGFLGGGATLALTKLSG